MLARLPLCCYHWLVDTQTVNLPRRKTETSPSEPQTLSQPKTQNEIVTQAPAATAETKEPKNIIVKGEQLQGKALLEKSASMSGKPIDEVAKECGYWRETTSRETGESRTVTLTSDFMAAMLKAQSGVEFAPPTRAYSRRTNRAPVVTVGGNGNIVVGNRYSSVAGFGPTSKVRVEAAEGKITIIAYIPAEGEEDGGEQDDLDL